MDYLIIQTLYHQLNTSVVVFFVFFSKQAANYVQINLCDAFWNTLIKKIKQKSKQSENKNVFCKWSLFGITEWFYVFFLRVRRSELGCATKKEDISN